MVSGSFLDWKMLGRPARVARPARWGGRSGRDQRGLAGSRHRQHAARTRCLRRYRRVITTVRDPMFPAASVALMVTAFIPTSSGTDAVQLVVPTAGPDLAKLVAHVTVLTPTLSLAVPRRMTVVPDVA